MSSNCYIVWDDITKNCFIVDPGSEFSKREIDFIDEHNLRLTYIILTHEHSDHNWGVNSLKSAFPDSKVICHSLCAQNVSKPSTAYFKLYFNRENYSYVIKSVNLVCGELDTLEWNNHILTFIHTPGHSEGSICINLDNWIFSGDSLMQFKPYIDKRTGSLESYKKSEENIRNIFFDRKILVYPGHGEPFNL